MADYRIIGRSLRKIDATDKVTGRTLFADDLARPRMLYTKLLRSHMPHGTIDRIDTSRALALSGVVAVLTGNDLPIPFGILPVSQDEHALCVEKAHAAQERGMQPPVRHELPLVNEARVASEKQTGVPERRRSAQNSSALLEPSAAWRSTPQQS